ncbi:MAG: isochorismatase family cysteine hydrolase [Dehalococcoidia bacterium]|nr:isochorismatase family cysteine hydrolase [Dehalococcoidia bacterium]MDZ4246873.1 isochorismatase family cysteine hydrolase [Dehalococcoidia bacterium]
MARAVIVVDMLKGFLEEKYPLFCGQAARRIIPNVRSLLEDEIKKGSQIFFLCDNHSPDDEEFAMFPPHCIAGTEEAEIIPELASVPGKIIPKRRFSCFFRTGLEGLINEMRPEAVVVCGVCTDICVMHTVADARNMGLQVEVPVDCVASFDAGAHRFALEHMKKVLGARLIRIAGQPPVKAGAGEESCE